MTRRRLDWVRTVRGLAPLALAASIGLAGCGKQEAPRGEPAPAEPRSAAGAESSAPTATPTAPANPAAQPTVQPGTAAKHRPDDVLHQSFVKAVRAVDDPPEECNRPPDRTMTGKSVFKLYQQVQSVWDTIEFVSPAGKPLAYTAILDTDEGVIEIALRPDLAPNHVRNFIALAKVGYYDGLCFERTRHEESEADDGPKRLDEIEAGCPLGTGDAGNGSIGYWLKPEFVATEKATHEEGTVGACRGYEEDTAACRFYITLNKAEWLDGNYTVFGKVTKGLDTARKIFMKKPTAEDTNNAVRRPEKPVLIRAVKIEARELP